MSKITQIFNRIRAATTKPDVLRTVPLQRAAQSITKVSSSTASSPTPSVMNAEDIPSVTASASDSVQSKSIFWKTANIGLTGADLTGKSSLINALGGRKEGEKGAAVVTETGIPHDRGSYTPKNSSSLAFQELPVSSQVTHPTDLLKCDVVLHTVVDRLLETDVATIKFLQKNNKPFVLVRTKCDQAIKQVMRRKQFMSVEEAKLILKQDLQQFFDSQGLKIPAENILFVSAWNVAEKNYTFDGQKLVDLQAELTDAVATNKSKEEQKKDVATIIKSKIHPNVVEHSEVSDGAPQTPANAMPGQNKPQRGSARPPIAPKPVLSTAAVANPSFQYRMGRVNVAVTGPELVGKSSLINVLTHRKLGAEGAAVVTQNGLGVKQESYTDVNNKDLVIHKVPEGDNNQLLQFDLVCLVTEGRSMEEQAKTIRFLIKNKKPYVLVRSRSDLGVQQMQRQERAMPPKRAEQLMRKELVDTLAELNVPVQETKIMFVSNWKMADGQDAFDGHKLKVLQTGLDRLAKIEDLPGEMLNIGLDMALQTADFTQKSAVPTGKKPSKSKKHVKTFIQHFKSARIDYSHVFK